MSAVITNITSALCTPDRQSASMKATGPINQAIILSGGLGTRLRPLTLKIPKCMVSVRGRPFVDLQLELLAYATPSCPWDTRASR